jgi:hypothetical protein
MLTPLSSRAKVAILIISCRFVNTKQGKVYAQTASNFSFLPSRNKRLGRRNSRRQIPDRIQETSYKHPLPLAISGGGEDLGNSEFVEAVLAAAEEQVERKSAFHIEGGNLDQVAQRVANLLQLTVVQVLEPSKRPTAVQARSLLCHWATRRFGMTAVAVSARLGLSPSAVSRSALHGEQLAPERDGVS